MTFDRIQYIKENRHSADPIKKLAARKVMADLATDYDLMIRLQILEGVADIKFGTWFKYGMAGLRKARAWFASNDGDMVNPEWFSTRNTGMFNSVRAQVLKELGKSYSVRSVDPIDLINSMIMGIGAITNADILSPFYGAGNKHPDVRKGILEGKQTPDTVSRFVSRSVHRKVIDFSKNVHNRQEQSLVDPSTGKNIDVRQEESDIPAWQWLSHLFFSRPDNQVAKKVQDLMEQVWSTSRPMTTWLNMVRDSSEFGAIEFPDLSSVADIVGISKQSFGQRHWKPMWEKFLSALFRDRSLTREVTNLMRSEGVEGDLAESFSQAFHRAEKAASVGVRTQRMIVGYIRNLTSRQFR